MIPGISPQPNKVQSVNKSINVDPELQGFSKLKIQAGSSLNNTMLQNLANREEPRFRNNSNG
jgi:hypothetical protein